MSKSTLEIGKLIIKPENKDAIHIAVCPVVAGKKLKPGEHVGLESINNQLIANSTSEKIGIIDPFLKKSVNVNEQCWLFLYPQTITSLRHEWTHPFFENLEKTLSPEEVARLTDKAFHGPESHLREVAEMVGLSYDRLLGILDNYVEYGDYHTFPYETPDCGDVEKMWNCYEEIREKKVNDKNTAPFSCAC